MITINGQYATAAVYADSLEKSAVGQLTALCNLPFVQGTKLRIMPGIWSSCISRNTIDESPQAYKPVQDILAHIGDTVKVLSVLKPVYNFKAGGE